MQRIYLDHAATTPARSEAIAAMLPLLGPGGFNPSSLYGEGRAARAALDAARATVARVLGAKPREIVFTGSGSESDVLAIHGAARAAAARGKHLISSAIEHHAVLHALDVLADDGWAVTRLPVDADGRISPQDFAAALRPDTTLATVMLANNEIGTIAPVAQIAALARARGVIVHTDATQCPGLLALDVDELGVDLLTISAHKFYGPKGVAALYVRDGTPLRPLIVGGSQEHGLRAGTENVAGIAGLAVALALAEAERPATVAALTVLRERLERGILAGVPDARINGHGAARLANNCSVAFAGVSGDALLIRLDLEGIAASAGSACAAGSLEPSHVVAALGLPEAYVRGVIRFSLGRSTTREQIDRVVGMLPDLVSINRGNVSSV
ncbi:MAG: cysteine desulfurase family protein [Candidatus Velthaea sp.]